METGTHLALLLMRLLALLLMRTLVLLRTLVLVLVLLLLLVLVLVLLPVPVLVLVWVVVVPWLPVVFPTNTSKSKGKTASHYMSCGKCILEPITAMVRGLVGGVLPRQPPLLFETQFLRLGVVLLLGVVVVVGLVWMVE